MTNRPDKGPSHFLTMESIKADTKEVAKLLLNLKLDKATGPDSIPAFILKTTA